MLVGAALLHVGCLDLDPGTCAPPGPVVRMPSGTFGPAVPSSHQGTTELYPHGPISLLTIEGGGGAGGEGGTVSSPSSSGYAIASARLQIDRDAGMVIRSYVDEAGRTVEERYRITRVP